MARRVHDADGEVIAACAARGEGTVTARKLERWRQAGCLPARPVEHRAGLAGSVSANPDGYVDQVLAISAALRGGLALRRVPIALFADGYPVELDALRSAYLDLVGSLRTMAAKVAGAHDDPLDAADAVAVAFAARLGESMLAPMLARARQTARQAGAGSRQGAHDLLTGALSAAFGGLLVGQAPSLEGAGELLTLAGLADGQDLETSARHLADTNVENIEEAVRGADQDRWFEARRMAEAISLYMRRRASAERLLLPAEQRLPGLDLVLPEDAFSRGCLIPQQLLIGDYERDFAQRRARAMDSLATHLESALASSEPHDAAEDGDQRRARALACLNAWVQTHPQEKQLVLGIDPDGPSADDLPSLP